MVDILFAAVPYVPSNEPIMAPGLLKSIAKAEGFSALAMDLNIEIHHQLENHPLRAQIEHALVNKVIDHDLADELYSMIKYCGEKILEHDPRIVGLSLLTYETQIFGLWLAFYIKNSRPDVKIIIGGSGIKDFVASQKNNYCEELKKLKLIDHYIMGDGEIALKEFLHGNLSYPGIDTATWIQPTDISNFPYPDYTDYDFSQYGSLSIPLTDSRGCVRTCEFCDIIEHWKKFVYRSADNLFDEMLHQISTHGITHFVMRNSLTNGHMKEFNKWLDQIVEYNQSRPEHEQMSWKGYFIVREAHQHPEELWDKLKKSNAQLILGVESVIQHVRWDMKKKFTNEAIDYHLEMGRKYQVPLILLMIVGSPSETVEDYEFTKQWFQDRVEYSQNSVYDVNLSLASVLPGTEWDRKQKMFEIVPGNFPSNWAKKDSIITPQYRLEYWKELMAIIEPFSKGERTKASQKVTATTMSKDMLLHI
jgi:hypothetical protein